MTLEDLNLTNPQRRAVTQMMSAQKNKYKKLLHETHERLHIIGDHTGVFEFWFNLRGHYEYVSPASERITGYAPAAFLKGGIRLEHIIHPDYKEKFLKDRAGAFSGGEGTDIEYKICTKSEEHRWVLVSWTPVKTRTGKLIGVRGSIRDITHRKSLERLAHNCSVELPADNGSVPTIGVFQMSQDGEVVQWSQPASDVLGYEPHEVIGSSAHLLHAGMRERADLLSHIEEAIREGTHSYSAVLRKTSGEEVQGTLHLAKVYVSANESQIHCRFLIL